MSSPARVIAIADVVPVQPRKRGAPRGHVKVTQGERIEMLRAAIRHLMAEKNISATALAKSVDLKHSVVTRFLSGQSNTILPKTLRRIAKGLDVKPQELRALRITEKSANEAVDGTNTNVPAQGIYERMRERISLVIMHRGLTLFGLARRAKISALTLYNFMGGKTRSMRPSTLRAISRVVGIPMSFFTKPVLSENDMNEIRIFAGQREEEQTDVPENGMPQVLVSGENFEMILANADEQVEAEAEQNGLSIILSNHPQGEAEMRERMLAETAMNILRAGLPPIVGNLRVIRAPNSFENIRRGDVLFVDDAGDVLYNSLAIFMTQDKMALRRALMDGQDAMLVIAHVTVT